MIGARPAIALLGGLALLVPSACSSAPPVHRSEAKVPLRLIPTQIAGGLTVSEYPGDAKAFADAGPDSLVADGHLWEIHQGHLLVGTLEAATVVHSVSLASVSDRTNILDGAIVGSPPVSVQIDGVQVAVASAPQRSTYVWFGREVFQVLQLDDHDVNSSSVAAAVIGYEQSTGLLDPEPLPKLAGA